MTAAANRPRAKKRPLVRRKKSDYVDIPTLIEKAFEERLTFKLEGVSTNMEVFAVIYMQLLSKEMKGHRQAARARAAYDEFARRRSPRKRREIIVYGGLPNDLPEY